MNRTDDPKKQPVPFGVNGPREDIEPTTPTGDNSASYNLGFPPITMLLKAAGGLPPKGQDMNQILYELSSLSRWNSAGALNVYDSAFGAAISGYPKGAVLSNSTFTGCWLNTIDANTADPENTNASLTGWVPAFTYGTTSITGLAAASVTLTALRAANERITLSGALTANINLIFPAWSKNWTIVNNCTGAFSVTCKTPSGTGIAVAAGATVRIIGDGTNIISNESTLVAGALQKSNNLSDLVSVPTSLANLGLSDVAHLPQLTGVVGTSRNAKMSIPSASAIATFTADELIVQTSLGGLQYKLSSFSNTVNLATTGAGGMDTGTVPATGYVALYAIYNPTSGASALLAVNATSARVPEVYGGANMPTGYTASALVSAWRIASSQFTIGYQRERHISIPLSTVYTTATGVTTIGPVSYASAVPFNAVSISVYIIAYQTSPGVGVELNIYSSSSGIGKLNANATVSGATSTSIATSDLDVINPQALFFNMASTNTGTYGLGCVGYSI
ncbi:tail fiber protein [Yersinia frederiksenii]|nr:tail fiber protein [Yersinia frederiksenii]CNH93695.1 tail fiber protein [Yersinia frederiksenii]